jgi:putative membrane protein
MDTRLDWFLPYYFYPEVALLAVGCLYLYTFGLVRMHRAGEKVRLWPAISFYSGVFLIYVMMHTGMDYLAQYLFLGHRFQHLVIHHHAPLLLVLGGMGRVFPWALPQAFMRQLRRQMERMPLRVVGHLLGNPLMAGALFVGLILIWMTPEAHFQVMLNLDTYRIMNASMVLSGVLFWSVMLNPRGRFRGGYSFGLRLLLLWFIMLPQILLGAYVSLVGHVIYDVYDVCGRAFPISAMTDQRVGGLLTWIPAAEMMAIVAVLVIRLWMREESECTPGNVLRQA